MTALSPKTRDRMLYFISPIGLLLLWQLLLMAGLGDRRFIPAPTDIAVRFWALIRNGELALHTGVTLLSVFAGYVIDAIPAIVVGLLMAAWIAALSDQAVGTEPSLESPGIRLVSADPSLPRTGWTVAADSQQPTQPATYVLDGNPATFWHSKYSAPAVPLPHTLTIDMHAQNLVTAVRYLARTDRVPNGRVGRFSVQVSSGQASSRSAVAWATSYRVR